MSTVIQTESKPKKEPTATFKAFLEQFEKDQSAEERLRLALDFMRMSLSSTGNPKFEDFWGGKRLSLPLFKEALNPKSRALFWAEYIELSAEAKRLKEILDEQSAFAVEQIELAIAALENDLVNYDQLLAQTLPIDFYFRSLALEAKQECYNNIQKELDLLNTLASRVNGLRKEVIKTGMRIRQKTKFFERLSAAGDKIFPRRKDLIKQISDQFCADVEEFVQKNQEETPLFVMRDEIKALQAIAKLLTLNTHAFTETRVKLSRCWDEIREKDKERKKEFALKKLVQKENYDKMRAQEEQEKERLAEMERQKRERLQQLKDKIASVLLDVETTDLDVSYEDFTASLQQLQMSKSEKMLIEKSLKQLKDAIVEKKEKALLNLSADDLQTLENFKTLLAQRKERRGEIKNQIEAHRKAIGGSGFDFEKAMMYRELMDEEKERLDKANAAVIEIEEKIEEIENK